MTSTQLILLRCFARTNQIAQCLGALIGNPDRSQIARSVTARQLLGITPIRLHPIAGLHWHQAWRYHVALNAQLCQLPVDDIPGRSGLITGPQLLYRAKLLDQLAYRFQAVRNRSQASHLTIRLRNRDGDRLGMDIQTQKS
jgi:hypothetical protein